jgi:hypothetical protein
MSNHNPPTNGFDKRRSAINRKGRPKSFDALRSLAQDIAHEGLQTKDGQPVLVNGKQVTTTEFILRRWANSGDPRQQQAFMDIAYGKVSSALELTGKGGERLIPIREIIVELPAEDTNAE